ncbi:MAG: hypothetical protein H6657_10875 [Ardenticatenaceae bacterium]|nr:hypothetical protein [Ardenticatenaceae bacterium]
MKIGTIVEGPTDRLLLKAVVDEICHGEHEYLDLQPADLGDSFGERGSGWKGVRRFCFDICQQLSESVSDFIIDFQLDLLIIHIDADVALEEDLQEGAASIAKELLQPCPPITLTTMSLEEVVTKWLNLEHASQLPSQVILAIPAQDSENWVFAALFPEDELCQRHDFECIHASTEHQHPAYLLTLANYGRILRRKDGKIRKSRSSYRQVLPQVVDAWDKVCSICFQAQTFNNRLTEINDTFR